ELAAGAAGVDHDESAAAVGVVGADLARVDNRAAGIAVGASRRQDDAAVGVGARSAGADHAAVVDRLGVNVAVGFELDAAAADLAGVVDADFAAGSAGAD